MGGIDDYFWTSDTLFSTINNTPNLIWPDSREIAKAGIADFIQPSLGPLQPNLDDFMNGIPFQGNFSFFFFLHFYFICFDHERLIILSSM